MSFALSCRGTCEKELAALRDQLLTSRKLLDTQKRSRFMAASFFAVLGLVFVLSDVLSGHITLMATGPGIAFLALALGLFIAQNRWTKPN